MILPTLFDTPLNREQLLTDLFVAYFDARKNKRNTIHALEFELNFEERIFVLHQELLAYQYTPLPSICFMVKRPVLREVFAANFRDRVVHHLIYNYINPVFESVFIHDSYACRVGKGTHYGIQRVDHFIRSCTRNYTQDGYILKLDIKGYFMAIDKHILYQKIAEILQQKADKIVFNLPFADYLIRQTLFHNSVQHCRVYGRRQDWCGLPKDKSLFYAKKDCGLPIGNLTSQLFGNIYLNDFDHFVKKELGIHYYGRYVDDMILVHANKEFLLAQIPCIRAYLKEQLHLSLHPNKIYLQHYSKGVRFLGAVIKPYRIYVAALLENNQNAHGINIPAALQSYTGFERID